MPLNPAIAQFMIKIAESTIPIVTGAVMNGVRAKTQQNIIESYSQNITAQQDILSQHDHGSGAGSKFLPNIPHGVSLHPVDDRKKSEISPFVHVPDSGDLDQMHAEKWNEFFGKIYDLNDNASTGETVKTMKNIQADIEKYPCKSCQENSKEHLKEMKQDNDQFTRVSTKKDAIMKLCRFKNKINDMKGNDIFPCDSLIQ